MYGKLAVLPTESPAPASLRVYEPSKLPDILGLRKLPPSMDPTSTVAPAHFAQHALYERYPDVVIDQVIREMLASNSQSDFDLAACVDSEEDDQEWMSSAILAAQSPHLSSIPDLADEYIVRLQRYFGVFRAPCGCGILGLTPTPDVEEPESYQQLTFFRILRHLAGHPDYVILDFLVSSTVFAALFAVLTM